MSKKVIVGVDKTTGKLTTKFEGFQGGACFTERDTLLAKLKERGVETELITEERTPEAKDGDCVREEEHHAQST